MRKNNTVSSRVAALLLVLTLLLGQAAVPVLANGGQAPEAGSIGEAQTEELPVEEPLAPPEESKEEQPEATPEQPAGLGPDAHPSPGLAPDPEPDPEPENNPDTPEGHPSEGVGPTNTLINPESEGEGEAAPERAAAGRQNTFAALPEWQYGVITVSTAEEFIYALENPAGTPTDTIQLAAPISYEGDINNYSITITSLDPQQPVTLTLTGELSIGSSTEATLQHICVQVADNAWITNNGILRLQQGSVVQGEGDGVLIQNQQNAKIALSGNPWVGSEDGYGRYIYCYGANDLYIQGTLKDAHITVLNITASRNFIAISNHSGDITPQEAACFIMADSSEYVWHASAANTIQPLEIFEITMTQGGTRAAPDVYYITQDVYNSDALNFNNNTHVKLVGLNGAKIIGHGSAKLPSGSSLALHDLTLENMSIRFDGGHLTLSGAVQCSEILITNTAYSAGQTITIGAGGLAPESRIILTWEDSIMSYSHTVVQKQGGAHLTEYEIAAFSVSGMPAGYALWPKENRFFYGTLQNRIGAGKSYDGNNPDVIDLPHDLEVTGSISIESHVRLRSKNGATLIIPGGFAVAEDGSLTLQDIAIAGDVAVLQGGTLYLGGATQIASLYAAAASQVYLLSGENALTPEAHIQVTGTRVTDTAIQGVPSYAFVLAQKTGGTITPAELECFDYRGNMLDICFNEATQTGYLYSVDLQEYIFDVAIDGTIDEPHKITLTSNVTLDSTLLIRGNDNSPRHILLQASNGQAITGYLSINNDDSSLTLQNITLQGHTTVYGALTIGDGAVLTNENARAVTVETGSLHMYGGSITGSNVGLWLMAPASEATLTGGTISGNSADVVVDAGKLYLGGSIQIGTPESSDGVIKNVFDGQVILLEDGFAKNAYVRVSSGGNPIATKQNGGEITEEDLDAFYYPGRVLVKSDDGTQAHAYTLQHLFDTASKDAANPTPTPCNTCLTPPARMRPTPPR